MLVALERDCRPRTSPPYTFLSLCDVYLVPVTHPDTKALPGQESGVEQSSLTAHLDHIARTGANQRVRPREDRTIYPFQHHKVIVENGRSQFVAERDLPVKPAPADVEEGTDTINGREAGVPHSVSIESVTGASGQNDLRGKIERRDDPHLCPDSDDLLTAISVTAANQQVDHA